MKESVMSTLEEELLSIDGGLSLFKNLFNFATFYDIVTELRDGL